MWRNLLNNRQGASLVELLIAVGLFALFALGIASLSYEGLIGSQLSDERSQAVFLAQEGLDAARSIRDRDWLNLVNGSHGLSTGSGYWEFSGASEVVEGIFTRTIIVSNVQRDGSGNIVLSGGTVDPRTKRVQSQITYDPPYGPMQTVALEAYLSDWNVYDWYETTDTEFGDGTHNSTEVTGSGDAAVVALEFGGGGGGPTGASQWIEGGGPFFTDTNEGDFNMGTHSDTQAVGTGIPASLYLATEPKWDLFDFPFGSANMNFAEEDFAVGDGGRIYRWVGNQWVQMSSGTTNDLYHVYPVANNEAYAVGAGGVTLRFHGRSWSVIPSPTTQALNSVEMVSTDDGWAVGNNGTILRWNGSVWTSVTSPTSRDLHDVHVVDANDVWAVGFLGTIVHWNGSTWSTVSSPSNKLLYSISMISASDGFAAGNNGEIIRYNGTNWVTSSSPTARRIKDVYMLSATDGFFVGDEGDIYRWDGSVWNPVLSPTNQDLESVYMISATDGWIVGDSGQAYRWDGASWLPYLQTSNATRRGVDTFADDLAIAVGDGGFGSLWNAQGWQEQDMDTSQDLRDVSIFSTSLAFAVGDSSVISEWDGSTWNVTDFGNQDFFAVDTQSASFAAAVGESGTIYHWNGASWTNTASPTGQQLNGVDLISANAGYAVGNAGTILSWNGASWSTMISPTGSALNDISMVSAAEGYAVGDNGTIVSWNGSSWSLVTSPTSSTLYTVTMFSSSLGYALGAGGVVIKWDGVNWSTDASPTAQTIYGASLLDDNTGWAVGANGTLLSLSDFYKTSGIFQSRIFDSGSASTDWYSVQWSENNYLPTDLTIATRTGNTSSPDGSWSPWSSELTNPAGGLITSPVGRYLQYRVTMTTSDIGISPALHNISIVYGDPGTSQNLHSVSLLSDTDGWGVGANGAILHLTGGSWQLVAAPDANTYYGVDMVSASDGWAVGAGGGIIRYTGSWGTFSSPTANQLNDVHMVSASDGWAVGNSGTIIRWNGTNWSIVASPSPSNLNGVFMLSATEGWAVGTGGTIIEWDGATWSSVTSPVSETLHDVFMVSAADGWAVGDSGKILRFNGSTWSEFADSGSTALYDLDMLASDAGRIVGENGKILRWDTISWVIEASPTTQQINAVDMFSTTEGWAMGNSGLILHYTPSGSSSSGSVSGQFVDDTQGEFDTGTYSSTQWDTDHVELTASSTTGTYTSEVFDSTDPTTEWDQISWVEDLSSTGLKIEAGSVTTGENFTTVNLQQTYTNPVVIPFYYESANTASVSARLGNIDSDSFDIRLSSPSGATFGSFTDTSDTDFTAGTLSNAVVTGSGSAASVFLQGTSAWNSVTSPTTQQINDIDAVSPTDIWAVANSAKFLRYNGTSWSEFTDLGGSAIYDVEAVTASNVWATGASGQIFHYNGSTWSQTVDLGNRNVRSLTVVSASDIWAVADHGEIHRYNGSTWSNFTDMGNQDIFAVDAVAPNDVWAGGASNKFYRFNGTSWSETHDLGGETVNDIKAISASNVWAVGTSGKIWRYNGTTWSEFVDLGADSINDLSVVSATDIWATGASGKIWRYNGTSWSEYVDQGAMTFQGITMLSSSSGWVVGSRGAIHRFATTYASSGTLESRIFDSGSTTTTWDTIEWLENIAPAGTNIILDTRTGNTSTPDGSWSAYAGGYTNPGGDAIVSPAGRYLQYRVTLSTSNTDNTPEFLEATIDYTIPGATISNDTVHYLVVEEGAYTMPDGTLIEARRHTTGSVAYKGSWTGDAQSYTHTFSSPPVVLHAVQTNNDPAWIESFVSQNGNKNNPPTLSGFMIAMNGAEAVTSHGSETLGWVAIETGSGIIDGVDFEAQITSDSVLGHDNGCYTFSFLNSYGAAPIALASQQEMDGNDGGWGVGCSLSAAQIGMHSEEDQQTDSERAHTTETFAFVAFESAFDYAAAPDLTFQVRSCDDAACSGESFVGPDGTVGTVFTTPAGEALNVPDNRYFQYQATFTSPDGVTTAELSSVTIDYTIPASGGGGSGYASPGIYFSNVINSDSTATEWDTLYWSETLPAGTDIDIAVRVGNTPTPDGTWSAFTTDFGNPDGNIINLTGQYLQYRATLVTANDTVTPELRDVTVTYKPL